MFYPYRHLASCSLKRTSFDLCLHQSGLVLCPLIRDMWSRWSQSIKPETQWMQVSVSAIPISSDKTRSEIYMQHIKIMTIVALQSIKVPRKHNNTSPFLLILRSSSPSSNSQPSRPFSPSYTTRSAFNHSSGHSVIVHPNHVA